MQTRAGVGLGVEAEPRPAGGWLRTFRSLRNRDYRWLWLGYLFSFGALQMQMVARGWLVYDISSSVFLLGLVMSMWGFAVLIFSPLGGIVADRVDKRNLLALTQAGAGLVTVAVAVLITLEVIEVWHLAVASLLSGVIWAFNMPARQAFIAELVGERELMNAIALSSAAMNLTRIGAPAVAGLLVEVIGVAGVYWIVAGCYLFVVPSLLMVHPRGSVLGEERRSRAREILAGFRYVRSEGALVGLLALGFVAVLLGWNYQAFLPAIAVDVLKTGPGGFGMLMAFGGVGALVGTLAVATLGDFRHKGLLMLAMAVAMGATLVLFATAQSYYLALGLIMLVGLTSMVFLTVNNTLLQLIARPQMRGRVMSLMLMTWGLQPLGVLPFGILADQAGAAFAVGVGGALLLLAIPVLVALYRPLARL